MHEPSTDVTMDTLIARAAESIEPLGVRRLQEGLLAAAMSLAEVQAYEEALAMNDPVEANAMILAREEEPTFEMLRASVLSTLYSRMKRREETALKAAAEVRSLHGEVAEEVAEYIELDRMREASFRRDPAATCPAPRTAPFACSTRPVLANRSGGRTLPLDLLARGAAVCAVQPRRRLRPRRAQRALPRAPHRRARAEGAHRPAMHGRDGRYRHRDLGNRRRRSHRPEGPNGTGELPDAIEAPGRPGALSRSEANRFR